MPEAAARRLVLVRAIDEVDVHGKLVSAVERDHLEQRALEESRTPGAPLDAGRYLEARARRILEAVANRNPQLASLHEPAAWQRALAWLLPLAALVLGAALDRIDNPRQVNLLSPPLLAFLLWNLLVYAGLGVAALLPSRVKGAPGSRWAGWLRDAATPRAGSLRAGVRARYHLLWLELAGALESQRWKAVLHASALTWAVGVALSIAIGGLVREYRVGWESTLLSVEQVQLFLRVLFSPVTAVLGLQPFSLEELQQLHFRSGATPDPSQARRWVGLYMGLLLLLVALPRAVLALHAAWRRWRLRRVLAVDLSNGYFVEVLGRVSPARVLVALLPGTGAARAALLHAFRQAAPPGTAGPEWEVIATPRGDSLRLLDVPQQEAVAAADAPRLGMLARWLPRAGAVEQPRGIAARAVAADVLLAADDAAAAHPLAQSLAKPVACVQAGPCWVADGALLQALAQRLPSFKAPGMARIAQAWHAGHQARFAQAMQLLAADLAAAAADSEEVGTGPLNLRRLIDPAERDALEQARLVAMRAVLARVEQARGRAHARLLDLYVATDAGELASPALQAQGFRVREGVDSPQAGMAGAASGAALGATVDLMVGGLTLGAATALGALVGGGAAYVAAAWKNRTAPSGAAVVQLSDDMLVALTELSLLQYLAVIHQGRRAAAAHGHWQKEVAAAVMAARPRLQALWAPCRADPATAAAAVAAELRALAVSVLEALYGPGLAGSAVAPQG